jgi:hypothetical protein
MGIMAFTPMGNTVTFTAAVTPPTPVQAVSTTIGGTQYRVHNLGNNTYFTGATTSGTAVVNITPGDGL